MAVNYRSLPKPWTPQQDVDQALAYSDPIQQNRALINQSRNGRTDIMGLNEWKDYDAVLQGRGAQMAMPKYDLRSSLPAGYTEGTLDQELDQFANTGSVMSNTGHTGALEGLRGAAGLKPQDRAKIAGGMRQQMLPGGRMI